MATITGMSERLGFDVVGVGLGVVALGTLIIGGFVAGVAGSIIVDAGSAGGTTTMAAAWSWAGVARSLGYGLVIGVLATAIGWPAAWVMGRARGSGRALAWALAGVPLLMPMYLAYAGWGLIRGPGTWAADLLARGPAWWSEAAGRGLAVLGLSLWAWPLAAGVLAMGVVRTSGALIDALALEPAGIVRRQLVLASMLRGWIVLAVLVVAGVMLGSAVPLHLAQVPTAAIQLWTFLSLAGSARETWLAGGPLLLAAGVMGAGAGAWLARDGRRDEAGLADEGARRTGAIAGMGLALAASVLGPLAMFAVNLRDWSSVPAFWRANWAGARESLITGAWVGLMGMLACVLVMLARTCGRGRWVGGAAVACAAGLVALGLAPGVLVGRAVLGLETLARTLGLEWDGRGWLVLAHAGRFAMVGALVGLMLARGEGEDERGARLLSAGRGVRGAAVLRLRPAIGAVAGVGLACAALSVHEIEATVQLGRPGVMNLAQTLLSALHFARDEQLCAACLSLMSAGVLVAGVSGWLIGRGVGRGG
jgi:ABC-type Fe3+ transport system permease subunit